MTVRYLNQVTLGNWLTIGGMAVAVFIAWGSAQTRISLLEEKILQLQAAHSQEIVGLQKQFDEATIETRRVRPEVESRLRALEATAGASAVEVRELKGDIIDLKGALSETNQQLREVAGLLRQANGAKP